MRRFAGEDRLAAARGDDQAVQVAKGMDHADDAEPGEQEDQRMAERQVVVDGADQHQEQRRREQQTAARRDDENPALAEAQGRRAVAAPAKQVLLERRDEAHGSQGMATLRISVAMSSARAWPPPWAERRRCRATAGRTAWTSSGRTMSRPSSQAQARAAASRARPARGDRPCWKLGVCRLASTNA